MSPGPEDAVRRIGRIADDWTERLTRYAASILRDGEMARDAVQDVLLKLCDLSQHHPGGAQTAFSGLPTDEPAVRAWLFKAVRNRCIDLLRREGRMSLLEDHHHTDAHPVQMRLTSGEPDGDDPSGAAERHEQARAALAALERLPVLQREALRLKFSGELSYKQIAETMNKSVSHVGVLIHEGLKSLRQQLA
jgi:RNA polymerase sigma-70 factor (ECF subfamily)